jgi:hypothetical protein
MEEDMLKNISSSRLRVEVAEPDTRPNATSRFDRAGFVTEVELDGEVRFCASEPNNLLHPSSGGRGLCNEYKLNAASVEAVSGTRYPKPGVGLLLKEGNEPYILHRKYNVNPFDVSCSFEESKAVFFTEPLPCMGYALRQVKTLEVSGNALTMSVALENVGERTFTALEYCHNFISIAGMALGPSYILQSPFLADLGTRELSSAMVGCGHGFTFSRYQPTPMEYEVAAGDLIAGRPFEWLLSCSSAKARVSCVEDINLGGVHIWASDHMVSMETFHAISLVPGARDSWMRTWRFDRD